MKSTATVNTRHASKYLQQLCKHFAHKVEVEFDTKKGIVAFSIGSCFLHAHEMVLEFICEADGTQELQEIQSTMDRHLKKFAWREELAVDWHKGANTAN